MDPIWLGAIIPLAIAATAAVTQYLTSRRTGSGRIRTTEAEDLWEQTQEMMRGLRQDKERAETQRDKLMDIVEEQMMPSLEVLAFGQKRMLGLLTELAGYTEKS